ncbi:hypothetical protein FRC02_004127 [Tulasnella sp. 418]|nr:hypothetical protein FRC02_004127 [Tulasnella sp. 418]
MLAAQLQRTKPSQIPDMSKLSIDDPKPVKPPTARPSSTAGTNTSTSAKSKTNKGSGDAPKSAQASRRRRRRPLPTPPQPFPPLQDRVSMYSPLLSSNVLLEGWKVGTEKGPGGDGSPAAPGGMGKGKRKVIRFVKYDKSCAIMNIKKWGPRVTACFAVVTGAEWLDI